MLSLSSETSYARMRTMTLLSFKKLANNTRRGKTWNLKRKCQSLLWTGQQLGQRPCGGSKIWPMEYPILRTHRKVSNGTSLYPSILIIYIQVLRSRSWLHERQEVTHLHGRLKRTPQRSLLKTSQEHCGH